ncbi:calcium-binding protein [Knoellia sp. CPCC 206450]|uniref:calcium-binding protein n=1 Tax=Knoellia tibetensis TaxID=3404798 RepID=UPI003B43452A
MRTTLIAALTCLGTLSVGAVALAPAAQAATYTSSGVKCTKVGTPWNDTIHGTAYNDVICGLGGNDVIYGWSGNDVIDAGVGTDKVYGGRGADTIYGQDGYDTLSGQEDNDRIEGGVGNDIIVTASGADVVLSGAGHDFVDLGDGNDWVDGGTGADKLVGGTGADTIVGGADGDTVSGGSGTDTIYGNDGNDDLVGGSDRDLLSGGGGTNWCEVATDDVRYSCKTDVEKAGARDLSLSPSTVDVTNDYALVTYRVRVTDDTGVLTVQVGAQYEDGTGYANGGMASLESGTIRDGWWTGTLNVPRYIESGSMMVNAFMKDRVGRHSSADFRDALKVVSRNPDRSAPKVVDSWVGATTVDVRTSERTFGAAVRILDDVAGAAPWSTYICPSHLYADGFRQAGACSNLELVSGTIRDGWWRTDVTIPKGSVSGTWNLSAWVEDASSRWGTTYWDGPDMHAWQEANPPVMGELLPGKGGRFGVVGVGDSHAPSVATVRINPHTVDGMAGPSTVTIDVAAKDVEGVSRVSVFVGAQTSDSYVELPVSEGRLVSGTSRDGVWRFTVDVVQGTPPDEYHLQVAVEDLTHWVSYVSPGSQHEGNGQITLTPSQLPDSPGFITVT